MIYKVHLEFDDIYEVEADSEDEAIDEATNYATHGGDWNVDVEEVEEEDD